MNVPFYAFPAFVRGDTAHLAFVAKRRALFSGFIDLRPLAGAVLTWKVERPGQADLVKSTASDGGLALDTVRSRVDWPVSSAESESFALGPNPYRIRATFPDGRVETLLAGTISTRD